MAYRVSSAERAGMTGAYRRLFCPRKRQIGRDHGQAVFRILLQFAENGEEENGEFAAVGRYPHGSRVERAADGGVRFVPEAETDIQVPHGVGVVRFDQMDIPGAVEDKIPRPHPHGLAADPENRVSRQDQGKLIAILIMLSHRILGPAGKVPDLADGKAAAEQGGDVEQIIVMKTRLFH